MRQSLRVLCLVSMLSLLSACGYQFAGGGSVLPPDVKAIHIPIVENNTTEGSLSLIFTEALRDRFERYGVVSIVETANEADAVLTARVLRVQRETQTVTSQTDTSLQERTIIQISAELRRVTGPVLWRNDNLIVSRAFGAASSVVVTSSADFAGGNLSSSDLGSLDSREVARGQERAAFEYLCEDAARKIYDEAVAPEF
jgi:outer membrane lipopolysaccharide assembly protein LptE/RlpB